MKASELRFLPCGDSALTVQFSESMSPEVNARIRHFSYQIEKGKVKGATECVPTFCSATVYFDPSLTDYRRLEKAIRRIDSSYKSDSEKKGRVFLIPVCYEGEFAPDMADLCLHSGLTEEEAKRKVAQSLGVQVLEAAASGALIGGGMTAIGGGVGLAKVDKARRKVGKSNISGGKTATLIEEATEAFKGEEYKKQQALIQKVEKGLADNKQGRSQQRNYCYQ